MQPHLADTIVGTTPGDLAVRPLGVVRLSIPVPFTAAGSEVNAYLVDNADGSLTMFDTGFGSEAAVRALRAGFAAAGRRLDEVRRIVVSHGHPDHFGGARAIPEWAHVPVHVHPRDAAKLLAKSGERGHSAALGAYLVELGAPIAELMQIGERYRKQVRDTALLDEVLPLEDGQELELRSFRATVVHTPGHTPGHIALHAPGPRVLLSADHLLSRISPCPLIELGPHEQEKSFRALVSYLESVRRVEALDLDWVLPGHGEPFTGHRPLIASLRSFYEERQARLLALLEPGPRTPYELAVAEFGPGRVDELFLTLSEMVGNLEVLEQRGRVERIAGTTPHRYRRS